jgi:L-methionine (R)-S-oxide reductase
MSESLESLLDAVRAAAAGPGGRDARLQSICDLLGGSVPHYDWVGFYLVEPGTRTLLLGPFSGEPTEHVRIPFGRGICGQAAETGRTFVVQDVRAESNYLSCSASVRSEIVVPVVKDGAIVGELDVDSHAISPFTDLDSELLGEVCRVVAAIL